MENLKVSPVLVDTPPQNLLQREAELLLAGVQGLPEGLASRAAKAAENKGETALELGIAFGVGAALSLCAKNPRALWGACGGLAQLAKPVLAAGMAADVATRVGLPMLAVARDASTLDQQKQQLGSNLGAMTFDYTLMGAAGYAGSRFGGTALHTAISEIKWRNSAEPLKVECQQAARLITNELSWTQNQLPEQTSASIQRFQSRLGTHFADSYGIDGAKAKWMVANQGAQPIPEKLSLETLSRFEAALADELMVAARLGRDGVTNQFGGGGHAQQMFAEYVSNRIGGPRIAETVFLNRSPRVMLSDGFTSNAARAAGIESGQFKDLVTWRNILGNGITPLNIHPGFITRSNFAGTSIVYPQPFRNGWGLAGGVVPSVTERR